MGKLIKKYQTPNAGFDKLDINGSSNPYVDFGNRWQQAEDRGETSDPMEETRQRIQDRLNDNTYYWIDTDGSIKQDYLTDDAAIEDYRRKSGTATPLNWEFNLIAPARFGLGAIGNGIRTGLKAMHTAFTPSTWLNPFTGTRLLSPVLGTAADAGIQGAFAYEGLNGLYNQGYNGTLMSSPLQTFMHTMEVLPMLGPMAQGIGKLGRGLFAGNAVGQAVGRKAYASPMLDFMKTDGQIMTGGKPNMNFGSYIGGDESALDPILTYTSNRFRVPKSRLRQMIQHIDLSTEGRRQQLLRGLGFDFNMADNSFQLIDPLQTFRRNFMDYHTDRLMNDPRAVQLFRNIFQNRTGIDLSTIYPHDDNLIGRLAKNFGNYDNTISSIFDDLSILGNQSGFWRLLDPKVAKTLSRFGVNEELLKRGINTGMFGWENSLKNVANMMESEPDIRWGRLLAGNPTFSKEAGASLTPKELQLFAGRAPWVRSLHPDILRPNPNTKVKLRDASGNIVLNADGTPKMVPMEYVIKQDINRKVDRAIREPFHTREMMGPNFSSSSSPMIYRSANLISTARSKAGQFPGIIIPHGGTSPGNSIGNVNLTTPEQVQQGLRNLFSNNGEISDALMSELMEAYADIHGVPYTTDVATAYKNIFGSTAPEHVMNAYRNQLRSTIQQGITNRVVPRPEAGIGASSFGYVPSASEIFQFPQRQQVANFINLNAARAYKTMASNQYPGGPDYGFDMDLLDQVIKAKGDINAVPGAADMKFSDGITPLWTTFPETSDAPIYPAQSFFFNTGGKLIPRK